MKYVMNNTLDSNLSNLIKLDIVFPWRVVDSSGELLIFNNNKTEPVV